MIFLYGIIGLSVLIFAHELGHFLVAKACHTYVEEFSLGYPPRLGGFVKSKGKRRLFWGKNVPRPDKGATIYSLGWIPFGGFNKLKGEFGKNKDTDSFFAQTWWKKIFIALGGVAGNILLSVLIFTICFTLGSPQVISHGEPAEGPLLGIQILGVDPSSPAAKAGVIPGDIILKVDNNSFGSLEELQAYIRERKDIPLIFHLKRGKKNLSLEITPKSAKTIFPELKADYGVIGVNLAETALVSYPWYKSLWLAIENTFSLMGTIFAGIWLMLKSLFTKGVMIGQVIGPVGLVSMSSKVAKVGFIYFLQITGTLSVALAACQLIPFPALDGSRVVFALIEGIRRGRPIPPKVEATIVTVGFYILLFLIIFVTYKDIARLL